LNNEFGIKGTILLLGGTGFIGKSVLDLLNHLNTKKELKIILVSRGLNTENFDLNRWHNLEIQWIKKPIDELQLNDLNTKIDYVIHAATSTNSEAKNLNYLIKTLIFGTMNIVDLCTQLKPRGVLYLSSGAIYGLKRSGPPKFKETDLYAPDTTDLDQSYGHLKRLNETLWSDFYRKTLTPTAIARCFAFSGKNLDTKSHFAICNFIEDAKKARSIKISGNGSAVRSYLDEEDLAIWLLTVLIKNKSFDVVNIGSDEDITIKQLAEAVQSFYPDIKIDIQNIEDIPQNYYVPNITRAKEAYGLSQSISLKASLSKMTS